MDFTWRHARIRRFPMDTNCGRYRIIWAASYRVSSLRDDSGWMDRLRTSECRWILHPVKIASMSYQECRVVEFLRAFDITDFLFWKSMQQSHADSTWGGGADAGLEICASWTVIGKSKVIYVTSWSIFLPITYFKDKRWKPLFWFLACSLRWLVEC